MYILGLLLFPMICELTRGLVWTCRRQREDHEQCPFFVWQEEEAEAKAWLEQYGPQEDPETPSKTSNSNVPKPSETPWTKSKKKLVFREVSDENENGGPSDRVGDDGEVFDEGHEGMESPSNRAAKRQRFSTQSSQHFNEELRETALPPTPDTLGKGKGKAIETAPILAVNTSPTPSPSKDVPNPARGRMEDLTTKVMELLREEKLKLKMSTELLLRHEIDLQLELNATKVRQYEETISKLSQRIDELENIVELLTAGGTSDDPIELTD